MINNAKRANGCDDTATTKRIRVDESSNKKISIVEDELAFFQNGDVPLQKGVDTYGISIWSSLQKQTFHLAKCQFDVENLKAKFPNGHSLRFQLSSHYYVPCSFMFLHKTCSSEHESHITIDGLKTICR